MSTRTFLSCIALFAGFAAAAGAHASGLQVSPVSLSLTPTQNADGLWLSNSGDNDVQAQVRVFHWTQEGGEEKLTPSRGLVVSPPMLKLAPGEKQLIRVIRTGAPPSGAGAVEDAYRIAIDELPVETKVKKGLRFVLHYSVPVFVEPVGAAAVAPKLVWAFRRNGEGVTLDLGNQGNGHAQIADLTLVGAGDQRTTLAGGLVGYALPGASVHWNLKISQAAFSAGGHIEAMVNGEKATQAASLADPPR
ncbi:MAG: molecular chaperone [Rudaea sp.]|uniref:fimbrial biogenesis chaperone n=1 Tax=unclassified Rudaea TaxID=2627037 RepID=UPI0010F7BF7B|nr:MULTISPECIES: fimbria/pilus periplasmic chaperone [unclassified Rudaea]MBN8887081.1 molecular chaperone [Rudaea sp.]MBR0344744.1 molecular chaperone [Rudaea sp.]